MILPNVFLGLTALVMVVSGVFLVTTRNVVHAALSLMMVLAGVASIFLLLGAEFLGWTQVLVYIGAIVVLFMFGVMLTKGRFGESDDISAPRSQKVVAAAVAALVFVLLTVTYSRVFGTQQIKLAAKPALRPVAHTLDHPTTARQLGNELFANWVLPFEAVSVVLLAALVGAIVLARRDDPEHVRARLPDDPEIHQPPGPDPDPELDAEEVRV